MKTSYLIQPSRADQLLIVISMIVNMQRLHGGTKLETNGTLVTIPRFQMLGLNVIVHVSLGGHNTIADHTTEAPSLMMSHQCINLII